MRIVEIAVLCASISIAVGSYFIITAGQAPRQTLTPLLAASLLVANLLPIIGLEMLIGRRIAQRRAAASPIGGKARLHVRLVALFSFVAAVPTLLVVIFASVLFQYGVEFWFSDRARGMVDNASYIARENYRQEIGRVGLEATAMSQDIAFYLKTMPIDSQIFKQALAFQTVRRELSEAFIIHETPDRQINSIVLLNPYEYDLDKVVTPKLIDKLDAGAETVLVDDPQAPGALTKLPYGEHNYLFVRHVFDRHRMALLERGKGIVADYQALVSRSRSLQLRFNAALLGISLLIVGLAVWIALQVADRLVRPVNDLVAAARRVADGDLSARVAAPVADDEVGTLATAFNAMTVRLQEQTGALVRANNQLDSRRALIEAVMSGVTAGVILVDDAGAVRLINDSAAQMLATDNRAIGKPLAETAPELAALLGGGNREAIVQIAVCSEARTLAVKIARADAGPILTFDDITQQLLDQRRAAWSDVARRIAHEIKNPLTPIQLAAERLRRRYAKQIENDDGTFARLTDTIVRQVTDLRRIVDEFSSFARMPKPMFREESLVDVARQALFLHEVAHSDIDFSLVSDDPAPHLVCDRRQIGQALTNIVKNAVEAIEARGEGERGKIEMAIHEDAEAGTRTITVSDNGVGLPLERDRIVEPYMTTRSRGTGLGLAIVTKIVEEHFGTINFADRPGGGTVVTLSFDGNTLAALDRSAPEEIDPAADRLAALTPQRNG